MNTQRTTAEWIDLFRLDWIDRGGTNMETWKGEYQRVFNKLPQNKPLTAEALLKLVRDTKPNSRQRVRAVVSTQALARFAKLDYDASRYRGKYSFDSSMKPRELPTDEDILDYYYRIENIRWRWVYAMMATYGLRGHEVFFLDLVDLTAGNKILKVLDGKTGPREVWPFHPEWFYDMQCHRPLIPKIKLDRSTVLLGNSISSYFRIETESRVRMPFQPYDLRHRYAVRLCEYGLETALAAKQMGHGLDVHTTIYYKWIARDIHQRAYLKATQNPNRPQAPKNPQSETLRGF
jgi:integrase